MAGKLPAPITRDQQFLAAILEKLDSLDHRVRAIEDMALGRSGGSAVCEECGRAFPNSRALRAHRSRSHKKE